MQIFIYIIFCKTAKDLERRAQSIVNLVYLIIFIGNKTTKQKEKLELVKRLKVKN